MLSVFNSYLHGYVAIPIILAANDKRIFDHLHKSNSTTIYNARSGYLACALSLFQFLGWIMKKEDGSFITTEKLPDLNNLPVSVKHFYTIPFENNLGIKNQTIETVHHFYKHLVENDLLEIMINNWRFDDERLSTFLDGAILLPILYLLKPFYTIIDENSIVFESDIIHSLQDLLNLFQKKDIIRNCSDKNTIEATQLGEVLFSSIQNAGVTLSYRPYLAKINDLMFTTEGISLEKIEEEIILDRSLNVIGSSSQHAKFFDTVTKYIGNYVNKLDARDKPVAIVDTGCGNGSLLKSCYQEVNCSNNLTAIGIDLSEDALRESEKTLCGIPHFLMKGDVTKPAEIISLLIENGYTQVNDFLHIRSFLDHEIKESKVIDTRNLEFYKSFIGDIVYIAANGTILCPAKVFLSLVEHFKKWASVVGKHGLITIEVYCLDSKTISKYFDQTESFHFDTYHRLSHQSLVYSHHYLMAAAEAGLIPEKQSIVRYPKLLHYTRISIQHFMKKDFIIRHAIPNDLNELIELEEKSAKSFMRSKPEQILKRIESHPDGQYVLEIKCKIFGVFYTQQIENVDKLQEMTSDSLESFHKQGSEIVQLINFHISPENSSYELSYELLNFVLMHNFYRNGIKKIVGISRCARFKRQDKLDYDEYIFARNKIGMHKDPILNMHISHGARVVGKIEHYRLDDQDNDQNGVYVEYNYDNWIKRI